MDKALMVASSVVKAGSSIMNGYSRASEMKQEAANYEAKARGLDLQYKQDSATRYDELDNALQTIALLQNARNVGIDSPTSIALEKSINKKANTGMLIAGSGFSQEKDVALRNAKASRKGAKMAIYSGYLNAVPSLVDAYGGATSKSTGK